ncbi:MAG: ABC transporter permease [Candidatus Onthomonas sp.]|nr:ABC transporter permease [Candidatus Onthomonas sp.]
MKGKNMKRSARTLKQNNTLLKIGGGISGFMVLLILISFFWTPYNTTAMDSANKFSPPSLAHIMGCDSYGRDIFSRILEGAGTSFLIAVCVVLIGTIAGILIGALTGYFGGWADEVLMRICDSITAFPAILLALVVVAVVGGSKVTITWILGILFIPSFARIVRGEYAKARELNYVKSARLMGAGPFRIMFRHILPNTIPVLLPAVTIGFNNAVLAEASMSYLGIGVQPPDASLGRMLAEAQMYLKNAPWYVLFVGLTIVLLILGFSMLGEGLQQRKR